MARWILSDVLFSTGEFEDMDALAEGWDQFEPETETAPLGA